MSKTAQIDVACETAGALLITPDGRYLLQHRDDIPTIPFPNMWALFGGEIEAGETPLQGLMRELQEEIGYTPLQATLFNEFLFDGRHLDPGVQRRFYFETPIAAELVPTLVQREGQGMRLFTEQEFHRMAAEIIPFDQAAIHFHMMVRRGFTRPTR